MSKLNFPIGIREKTAALSSKLLNMRHRFVGGVVGTFGLRIVSIALSFLTSLVLARILGTAGYGAYTYATGWLSLLTVIALVGTDKLLMRKIAAYRIQENWKAIAGIRLWSTKLTIWASLGIMLIMALIIQRFPTHLSYETRLTIWISLLLLPLFTLVRQQQSIMIGWENVVRGQIPEAVLRPLLFLIILGFAYLLTPTQIASTLAMWLQVISASFALICIIWLAKLTTPTTLKQVAPEPNHKIWMIATFPIFISAMLEVINARADIIMLGTWSSTEAVGIYNVAKRLTEPILFVLIAVNMTLAPRISSLYVQGKMEDLQQLITKTSRLALLGAILMAIFFMGFSNWLLSLWGMDFVEGQLALLILGGSQLVNVFVGSVALILLMTGHEKEVAIIQGIAATINISLNFLLIPRWGIIGTATATALGIIISNILLALTVYRHLKINPTAIKLPARTARIPI